MRIHAVGNLLLLAGGATTAPCKQILVAMRGREGRAVGDHLIRSAPVEVK